MRRVIGIDIHRTLGEVVFWEGGKPRCAGRIGMTGLEGFARSLQATDEVVIEATGTCMAGAFSLGEAGSNRQPAAGEGDRARACED